MALVTIELRTHLAAVYVFPDVEHGEVNKLLTALESVSVSQLTLVNASQAVLCIPIRIVAAILVDGEERWHSLPPRP